VEQDMQYTYSVTLTRVRVTIVAVENLTIVAGEKQYVLHIVGVCNLSYPACNAHAPYCRLLHAGFYSIFPHYLINGTNFEKKKKLWNPKCVFVFPLQLLSETFLILRRTERDIIKTV
jgi:hypothetical protein